MAPSPLQTVNGVEIAYLSYTDHTNGIPQSSAMTAMFIYAGPAGCDGTAVRAGRVNWPISWWSVRWTWRTAAQVDQYQRV
ncbi:hypothetical protein [Faecalibacterium hattorii]|uniref:hypothetical protein n=1 Tax=Faecalibacterium hattorii TaxID=2935520 RepID=UPI003AB0E26F